MAYQPKARKCPAWFHQAAELMVRNNISLKQASIDLGIPLQPDEVVRTERRKEWQEILREEGNKYHAALANDPTRTKSVAIGRIWSLANKLELEGKHEQAVAAIEKGAKLEGWVGNEGNINIFSGLTARDIAEAKERIKSSGDNSELVDPRRPFTN